MLGDLIGLGNGLAWVVGVCASVVMAVFVYLLFAPLVRRLFTRDAGLRSMGLQLREPPEVDLDQRIHDALAPPPGAVTVDDLDRPELFIPGVEALPSPDRSPLG